MFIISNTNTNFAPELFPKIEQFIQYNRWQIVFLIGISMLSYGYAVFNFNISIDAELIGVDKDQWYWISIGRWGMYLINSYLMLHTTIPVVPIAIALIFIAISNIAIFRLFGVSLGYASYIFPALAISFPTLPHILMFSTSAAGVGIAMLISTIGLYFYLSTNKIHKIYSGLCFVFAISVYQTFILVIVGVMFAMSINEFIHDATLTHTNAAQYSLAKKILYHLTFLSLVCLAYLGISAVFIIVRDVKPLYAGFIHPTLLFTNTHSVLKNSARYFYAAYLGHSKIYTDNLSLIAMLNGLAFLSLLKLKSNILYFTLINLFTLLAYLFIPFGFNLLNDGAIVIRALLALPLVSTLFWWMGYNYGSKLVKQLMLGCGIVLIIQFAIINNLNFNATGIVLDRDKAIAVHLIFAIDKIIATHANSLSCIELVGYKTVAENEFFTKHEVFGVSFFEWAVDTSEHVWRIYRFLRLMGLNKDLQVCSIEKSRSVIDVVRNMPAWPRYGAIQVVNEVLIVKLSN